jgi:hypothetical protein
VRENEKGTFMLVDVAILGEKCDEEASREDSKIYRPYSRNTAHVKCEDKCDTSNNRDNCNHLRIIQKIPEQRTGKARNRRTRENSEIGHWTHTVESTNVKAEKV